MPLFRRRQRDPEPPPESAPPPEELVRLYLRAQNLEQLRRVDEAVGLYELAVAGRFDSAGPYDRLIAIYAAKGAHRDVARIAEAALGRIRTFGRKRDWYEDTRQRAEEAARTQPDRRGPEF